MFQDVDKETLFGDSFENPHASHDRLKIERTNNIYRIKYRSNDMNMNDYNE
jgi:hypothetical protein